MNTRMQILGYTAAVLLLGLAASSLAAGSRAGRGVQEDPPPLKTWILVSKPPKNNHGDAVKGFPGVELFSGAGDLVAAADNPITLGATGKIAPAHAHNPVDGSGCDCVHYHGTLMGRDEPESVKLNCGWGCVVPAIGAPPSVTNTATAVMKERSAQKKIGSSDLPGAIQDLTDALASLKDARDNAPAIDGEKWRRKDNEKYQKNLECAEKSDKEASDSVKSAQNEQNDVRKKKKLEKAQKDLDDGLHCKQAAIVALGKWLGRSGGGD